MGVSCSCDYSPEPGDTIWYFPDDFKPLNGNRRQRCKGCGKLIRLGADCLEFYRYKVPEFDIEVSIYGEDGEIPRASHYLCEECGGLWLSLHELGLCVDYNCDQRENVAEFNAMKAEQQKFNEYWRERFGYEWPG